ncbi:MAG: hypothetical protein ACI9WH_000568 [Glaciecola sp.]|jgi:hypothetical protein
MKLPQANPIYIAICLVSLSMLASTGQASQTSPESQALIDNLVSQITTTMAAVADAEKKAGNKLSDLHVEIDIPAKQSPNLGLVLDINDSQGFRVLSVSPGSLADMLKIIQGDLIYSINGIKTVDNPQKNAFAELENTLPGDIIKLELNRKGTRSTIETKVEGQFTPPIKIEIGTSALSNQRSQVSQASAEIEQFECGTVSVFFRPPITKDLHSAYIRQIDDNNVNASRSSFRLPPGVYTIHVHELIEDSFFTRRSHTIQKAKKIEIVVEANTTYYLAAQFISKNRFKQKNGDYWEPVVWKTRENSTCKL